MKNFTNSFSFNGNRYYYCDLKKIFAEYPILRKLPNSLKILLESNIRNKNDSEFYNIIDIFQKRFNFKTIGFYPNRVIMKDFTGIPALIDLASFRDVLKQQGKNPESANPKIMFDLIMDDIHNYNSSEVSRNIQRYDFAKWASISFENLCVVPPSSSIYHQINLEYLSTMISAKNIDGKTYIFPECIIGTDNHTSMINSIGILGICTSGIEAQSAMLGNNVSLKLPEVIGVEIVGSIVQGVSISDAVLSFLNILKQYNVKNKIIEFYGESIRNISVEDRATISNSCSQYGAISAYFPIDENSMSFLEQTRGVDVSLIKEYYINQELFSSSNLEFDEHILFNLSNVRPLISGPIRFEDKIAVEHIPSKLNSFKNGNFIKDNDIVLASIRFCTHTSNPILLIQAALLAKKAVLLGLNINKNIKRTLLLDSLVLKEYLTRLDLLQYFEKLGFSILDYTNNSCTSFKEELIERVVLDIEKFNLNVSAVLSSKIQNDNSNSLVKSNWLMSPALVIAYSLKGNMNFDITKQPINMDIYLSDIWPSIVEVNESLAKIDSSLFANAYKDIFIGNETWQNLEVEKTPTYNWNDKSTYIKASNLYKNKILNGIYINDAKIVALLDDNISCEYLIPSGQVSPYSLSAVYLQERGLKPDEFNTYERRHGNSEIMTRATLSNIKLKNKIVYPKEGGYTKDFTSGELLTIYDFSEKMKENNKDIILIAGKNFGVGEFKDWAVKGIKQLDIKAIIAKSFDEVYRKNLIKVGVLPLEFIEDDIDSLKLKGVETISIDTNIILPSSKLEAKIKKYDEIITIKLQLRLDTQEEVLFYKNGGLLNIVD